MLSLFTIGHSTHPIGEFIGLLKAHGIALLCDIRTMPRSRYNPQFNQDALAASLKAEGIGYVHLKALGGMRKARPDSVNLGFRNGGFRGYADYMQTEEFGKALGELIALSKAPLTLPLSRTAGEGSRAEARQREGRRVRVAIMCAESVPWRCHRSLVADALVARGIAVQHIMPDGALSPHALRDFARMENGRVTYPAPADLFTLSP